MTPNLVVEKTAWAGVTPLCVLFSWLIIPFFYMLWRILEVKSQVLEFYDDYIIVRGGVFSTYERKTVLPAIRSVYVTQSFLGGIFGYGDIYADVVGGWDINLHGVCSPFVVKEYLESRVEGGKNIKSIVIE